MSIFIKSRFCVSLDIKPILFVYTNWYKIDLLSFLCIPTFFYYKVVLCLESLIYLKNNNMVLLQWKYNQSPITTDKTKYFTWYLRTTNVGALYAYSSKSVRGSWKTTISKFSFKYQIYFGTNFSSIGKTHAYDIERPIRLEFLFLCYKIHTIQIELN